MRHHLPLFILSYFLLPLHYLLAADAPGLQRVELINPLKINSLDDLLLAIINIVMVLMIPIIIFFIIYAGFLYVTARGNVEQVKKATLALTYAVIGGVLILGAIAISQIIKSTVDEFRRTSVFPSPPSHRLVVTAPANSFY